MMNGTTKIVGTEKMIGRAMFCLLLLSLALRGLIAAYIQLGNDEVYYTLYAQYPAWSYFDHPMMVALVQIITTMGGVLEGEFFVRLSSVLIGTINTYVIYRIGVLLKNARVGFYAAMLYSASLYGSVVCGVFIMPDGALSLFYLLAVWLMMDIFSAGSTEGKGGKMILLAAVIGLATLSKYHAMYLCVATLVMIALWQREWFGRWQFYAAMGVLLVTISPILIWNVQNDWVSFAYHGDRAAVYGVSGDAGGMVRELTGGMIYQNPVCWLLVWVAVVALMRRRKASPISRKEWVLLLTGIPVVAIFLTLSVFRDTLPHWSGMAYLPLMVLAAAYLDSMDTSRARGWIKSAVWVLALLLGIALMQIKTGVIPIKGDPTLDMYGWDILREKTDSLLATQRCSGVRTMVSQRWFPAAHMDYYVASPLGVKMLCVGPMDRIHEYSRINDIRGGADGERVLYLADENDYTSPEEAFCGMYSTSDELPAIEIPRGDNPTAKRYRVYLLNDFTLKTKE